MTSKTASSIPQRPGKSAGKENKRSKIAPKVVPPIPPQNPGKSARIYHLPVPSSSDKEEQGTHKKPYQHFKDAQKLIQDAGAPFAPNLAVSTKDFVQAITWLREANTSLLALRTALDETALISAELAWQRTSIKHQINHITETIGDLIPPLQWRSKCDFSSLHAALEAIERLFPVQERL